MASLDIQRPNGECVRVLDDLGHGFDLFTASIDGRSGEFLCLHASRGR
jgi:hypothetical protein